MKTHVLTSHCTGLEDLQEAGSHDAEPSQTREGTAVGIPQASFSSTCERVGASGGHPSFDDYELLQERLRNLYPY